MIDTIKILKQNLSMMKKTILIFLIFSSFCLYSYWEWTPQTGRWINPKYAVKDTPEEQFKYAEEFRKNGQIEYAIREHKKLLKHYPRSEYASQSCFILGQIYKEKGDMKKAFEYFQKIIDEHPSSSLVFPAIKLQSEIADAELKKKRTGIFKFFTGKDRAEYMNKVIENSPYEFENIERMFNLAEFYYQVKEYNESIKTLDKIIVNFPQTEFAEKAKYLKIKYMVDSIPKVNYDTDIIEEIREMIIEFTIEYPESEFSDEIEGIKNLLDKKEAEKYYLIARYYERAGKNKGAIYYYKKLIEKFPETEYGKIANEKVKNIK
ncbi:MAG: tetratricopeptide repeat protein [Candidatus Omnitrophica bacterium]|nr:tetratricopeptide repeat protein [Candidatus Omnitrophota bacterium]